MGKYAQFGQRKKLAKLDKEQLKAERRNGLKEARERRAVPVDSSLELTFNTRRNMLIVGRKYRAPRVIRDITKTVRARFGVSAVKIDTDLNKEVWSQGISNPPKKIRLLLTRRVEESGDKSRNVVHVSHLPVKSFHGLQTRVVEDSQTTA